MSIQQNYSNDQSKETKYKGWDYKKTLKNGLKSGIKTTWILLKIVIPVYFFVTFLKFTPVLQWISDLLTPVMGIVGLPGEASIALVLGNTVNLFAALGAIASLSLTAKETTIIAVMLSFSHSLFAETAVAKKTGISIFVVLIIRFSLAIISGIVLNLII